MKSFSVMVLLLVSVFSVQAVYKRKSAYSGFGKKSKATGRIKAKSTHGYFKKSIGYKFVNPYARS